MWALHRQVFEVRFDPRHIYWDRTGAIADELRRHFSGVEVSRSGPDQTLIKNPNKGLSFAYSSKNAALTYELDEDPDIKYGELAELFFMTVLGTLEITNLTRIGNRVAHIKKVPDEKTGDTLVDKFAGVVGISGRIFSETDDPRLKNKRAGTFAVRFEDDGFGIRLELSSGYTMYSAPIWGKGARISEGRTTETVHMLTLDADIYTKAAVAIDQFAPQEIFRSNLKLMETRILPLFQ